MPIHPRPSRSCRPKLRYAVCAPWNVRFFLPQFFYALWHSSGAAGVPVPKARSWLQLSLGVIIVWSAISLPLHCGQRRPLRFMESPPCARGGESRPKTEMIAVCNDVLSLTADRADRWFLVASENSWTLPFLDQAKMEWQLTPQSEQVKAVLAKGELSDSHAPCFEGSVATLELRRSLAIASAKLDRHRAEQTKNEAME